MKIIHLKTYLDSFSGLGDFPALFEELDQLEEHIKVFIESNRKKNTEIKQALLEEANEVKTSDDWHAATESLKEIKLKWIKTGSAYKELDQQLNEDFDGALDFFFNRRKAFFKEQRDIFNDRKDHYRNLVHKMRDVNYRKPEDALEIVKKLQQEWKIVGKIQRNKYMKLWEQFKREVDFFFLPDDKKRDFVRPKRKTGLELKKELLASIQKMYDSGIIHIARVKKAQKEWKEVGKLPSEEDKEINLSFRILCNEIFEFHFMENEVKENNPDYESLSVIDQIKLKIKSLRETLKVDESELNLFNQNNRTMPEDQSEQAREIIRLRGTYINKIKTKQRLLRKMQDLLLKSY